jgi:Leucine-rich repeat (LRR) protein
VVPLDPPTRNLRSLHLAHNNIIHIADISAYQRLSKLVLDGNQITDLSGLGSLPHLKVRL